MKSVAFALLAGCVATTTLGEAPGPRGLRADQYMDQADRESNRADEMNNWPEQRPSPGDSFNFERPTGAPDPKMWAGLWYGLGTNWAGDYMAEAHMDRIQAGMLVAEYQRACGNAPASVVTTPPLVRYGIGGSNTRDGVVVLLASEAGTPQHVLEGVRCFRAYLMLGRSTVEDSPLDLPGLHATAQAEDDGVSLTLTVENRSLVSELQRRTARDLETAARARRTVSAR